MTGARHRMTDAEISERIEARRVQQEKETAEYRRWLETEHGDYREGFIDGYLRAHDDGDEYGCSIVAAELAFGRYLSEGGRTLPRHDVGGW